MVATLSSWQYVHHTSVCSTSRSLLFVHAETRSEIGQQDLATTRCRSISVSSPSSHFRPWHCPHNWSARSSRHAVHTSTPSNSVRITRICSILNPSQAEHICIASDPSCIHKDTPDPDSLQDVDQTMYHLQYRKTIIRMPSNGRLKGNIPVF